MTDDEKWLRECFFYEPIHVINTQITHSFNNSNQQNYLKKLRDEMLQSQELKIFWHDKKNKQIKIDLDQRIKKCEMQLQTLRDKLKIHESVS